MPLWGACQRYHVASQMVGLEEGVRFASLSRPMAGVSVFNPAHAHAHQFCPIVTPIQAAENTSKAASYYYNGRMSVQCCLDLARHWGVRSG